MKKIFALLMLSIFVISGSYAQSHDELYKQAKNVFTEKRYIEAVQLLDKVLAENTANLMAYYYRGLSNYYLNEYDKAIVDLTKAIELYPTRADFYYYRALAQKAKAQKELAMIDLDNAIMLDDKQADYFYQRAELAMEAGKNKEAIMDYHKSLMLMPNVEVAEKRRTAFSQVTKADLDELAMAMPELAAAPNSPVKPKPPVPDDAKTIDVKKYIAAHKFASLQEGKQYYEQMQATTFQAGKKNIVIGLLRSKILTDVFGNNPYKEEVDKMKETLDNEYWLLPEGRKHYFNVIQNSKYYFTGGVQRSNIYYYYKVMKSKNTDKYRLQMYSVKNNESNLAFDSHIVVKEDTTTHRIEIFHSQNQGYRWIPSSSDYLKAEVNAKDFNINYAPIGNVLTLQDTKHGLPKDKYSKLIKASDKSVNAAIKATLHYVILDYPKMFTLPTW